jgi:hypothetical protein
LPPDRTTTVRSLTGARLARQQGRQCDGAARLRDDAQVARGKAMARLDLLLGHRDAAGARWSRRAADGERRDELGLERVAAGRRCRLLDRHRRAGGDRARHVVPAGGLDGHNLGVGQSQRDSGGEAAAAAGDQHLVRHAAELLADLDPGAALPFDDVDIVERGTRTQPFSAARRAPIASRLSVARS